LPVKAWYTLAIKSKGRRHLSDKNHPLSTKSTELNMFNFGDNVNRNTVNKWNEPATVDF